MFRTGQVMFRNQFGVIGKKRRKSRKKNKLLRFSFTWQQKEREGERRKDEKVGKKPSENLLLLSWLTGSPSSAAGPLCQGRAEPHTASQTLRRAGSRTWSLKWWADRPAPDPPRAQRLHQLTCSEGQRYTRKEDRDINTSLPKNDMYDSLWRVSVSHQKGGTRYGKGLFVKVCAAEQQQNVAVMFSFVKLEHLGELPQLIQVRRELQPGEKTKKTNIVTSLTFFRKCWKLCMN